MAMPVAAANTNQQLAALQKAIAARKADGKVTAKEANELLAQAKKEFVQGGELSLLRQLAGDKTLAPAAKDGFVKKVDQIVPAGAPTAQLAAILFRIDPKTGREQLLSILDQAKNPVAGGPKTFVVTGLGRPYLAAITSADNSSRPSRRPSRAAAWRCPAGSARRGSPSPPTPAGGPSPR